MPSHQSGRSPVAVLRGAVVLVGGDGALGDAHLVDLVGAVGEARPARVLRPCWPSGVSVE